MMRAATNVVLFLAAAGFASSATAHVVTFLGVTPRWQEPAEVGILLVFPFGLLASLRAVGADTDTGTGGDYFNRLFRSAPRWLVAALPLLLVYAVFNFLAVAFLNRGGVPSRWEDGAYVLHSHGTVIRFLSQPEYHRHKSYEARMSSAHSMLFYCFAGVMLCAARRQGGPARPDRDAVA